MMPSAILQPMNKLTNLLMTSLSQSGFTEALTLCLCSRDDITTTLRRQESEALAPAGWRYRPSSRAEGHGLGEAGLRDCEVLSKAVSLIIGCWLEIVINWGRVLQLRGCPCDSAGAELKGKLFSCLFAEN